jgi:hypothetical protein
MWAVLVEEWQLAVVFCAHFVATLDELLRLQGFQMAGMQLGQLFT